jgi:hypothetical protein
VKVKTKMARAHSYRKTLRDSNEVAFAFGFEPQTLRVCYASGIADGRRIAHHFQTEIDSRRSTIWIENP